MNPWTAALELAIATAAANAISPMGLRSTTAWALAYLVGMVATDVIIRAFRGRR